jgi:hypothetical protein
MLAAEGAEKRLKAFKVERRARGGRTLRPGRDTPLWNAIADEVQPYLKVHGAQAALGRLLGLDRQAIHAYFTARTRMPDAERALQVVTWLILVKQGRNPEGMKVASINS